MVTGVLAQTIPGQAGICALVVVADGNRELSVRVDRNKAEGKRWYPDKNQDWRWV